LPVTVVAHSQHWLTSVLYALPVVGLAGYLLMVKVRDARRPPEERRATYEDDGVPVPGDLNR